MASRVADEREQRRGLVLGLTLAEVLLLLLFLLLLAMASQLRRSQSLADIAQQRYQDLSRSLDQIKPIQEALMAGGAIDITNVQKLVLRFQQLNEVERELAKLKEENVVFDATIVACEIARVECRRKATRGRWGDAARRRD
jgi:hypothetical protein